MAPPRIVIGGDLSTDSMSYRAYDAISGALMEQADFNFLEYFGEKYNLTEGGYYTLVGDKAVRIPYGLLTDAIDLMLADVASKLGVEKKNVKRTCISLQQHGMGTWAHQSSGLLMKIGSDPKVLLSEHPQFAELFTTEAATSWRDTASEPDAYRMQSVLSPDEWASITGSSPMQALRFLGAQANCLNRLNYDAWDKTYQFNVLASIAASFLVGNNVPIGLDEASCTLAMNLETGKWAEDELRGYYPTGFFKRLPETILQPGAFVGTLSEYHVKRHGLSEDCRVLLGMGDNIAIMLTMANEPGQFGLSLGSSGTTYAEMTKAGYDPAHACHVLRSGTGGFMGMSCTDQCGKLANDVRLKSCLSWKEFDNRVASLTPGNDMIIHAGLGGLTYCGVNMGDPVCAPVVTRSILADMKTASAFMGDPKSIVVTGGFASNAVSKMVADLFQARVFFTPEKVNRVAMGSVAMGVADVTGKSIPEVAALLCPKGEEIFPNPAVAEDYRRFLANYRCAVGG